MTAFVEGATTTYLPLTVAAVLFLIAFYIHSANSGEISKAGRKSMAPSSAGRVNRMGGKEPEGPTGNRMNQEGEAEKVFSPGFWGWTGRVANLLGIGAVVYQILQTFGFVKIVTAYFSF